MLPVILATCQIASALEVPPRVAEREIVTRDHVEIKYHPDAWLLVIPRDPTVQLAKNEQVSPGVWHAWGPPGLYQVYELRRDTGQQTAAQFEIVKGLEPGPGPGPGPGPQPPPTELPKGVMILYETIDGGPAADKVNLTVRNALDRHYPTKWRLYDPDMTDEQMRFDDPDMVRLFARAKLDAQSRYPWICIVDDRGVQSLPLPDTANELLQLLPRAIVTTPMTMPSFWPRYTTDGW